MKHTTLIASLACILPLLGTGSAIAADGAALYKEKTCVACHGVEAKKPLLPIYPILAGQSKEYAKQQMLDIKAGTRSNGQSAAMKGIMHLVSEEEIEVLAEYLSSLTP
jgi:cytochrome c